MQRAVLVINVIEAVVEIARMGLSVKHMHGVGPVGCVDNIRAMSLSRGNADENAAAGPGGPKVIRIRVGRFEAVVQPAIEVIDATLLGRELEEIRVGNLRRL